MKRKLLTNANLALQYSQNNLIKNIIIIGESAQNYKSYTCSFRLVLLSRHFLTVKQFVPQGSLHLLYLFGPKFLEVFVLSQKGKFRSESKDRIKSRYILFDFQNVYKMQNLLKLILKRSYYSVARRKFRDRKFKDRKFMEKFNNLKKRKNLVKFNPFYKKIILNQFLLWILIFVSFITPWKSVICCKIFFQCWFDWKHLWNFDC